jgi:hypothetical protein
VSESKGKHKERYKVILRAGVQEGHKQADVVSKLAQLVKMPEQQVVLLLQRKSTVIKRSVDRSTAKKYHSAIQRCGAICVVKLDRSDEKQSTMPEVRATDMLDVATASDEKEPNESKVCEESALPVASDQVSALEPQHVCDNAHARKKSWGLRMTVFCIIAGLGVGWGVSVMWPFYKNHLERVQSKKSVADVQSIMLREKQRFKSVSSKKGRARVLVPDNWSITTSLSHIAQLQAAHFEEENYLMVIVQEKNQENDLSVVAYGEIIVEEVFTNISKPRVLSGPEMIEVSGLSASRYVVEGVVDHIGITYMITTIASEDNFYQLFTWTLTELFEKNKPLLEKVSNGFYEADVEDTRLVDEV